MPSFLLNFDPKRITIAVLVVVVVGLLAAVRIEDARAREAEQVYSHPRQTTKFIRVVGPVRIVTRIVEQEGHKETTIEETRAPVTMTNARETTPVPLSVALAPPFHDQWIVGVGNRNFSFRQWPSYSLWGGRDIGPHAAGLLGFSYRDGPEVQALVLLRFGR